MKNKKAQLKMQEMAFMLVAVVIFFVLVALFASSILVSNLRKSATESEERTALAAVTKIADSPEFNCVGNEPNCIDGDKVIGLLGRKNYTDFWPFTSLKLLKSSGFNKTEDKLIKCSISNYPNCDWFIVYDKKVKNEKLTESFVALCRTEQKEGGNYEKCEIAKLMLGTEIRG